MNLPLKILRNLRWEVNCKNSFNLNRHRLIFKEFVDMDLHVSLGGFQVEKLKSGNMYTGIYSGFTELDYGLLSLFSMFVSIKFSQIKEKLITQEKNKQLASIVSTMISLLGQRSYMLLIMELRNLMPGLVGYEYFGVYYHDKTCNAFYNHRRRIMYLLSKPL